jgi:hypothetical protein
MNYPANTVVWPIGSLVLHDFDAKRADMLMEVIKYLKDGTVRAEYVCEPWKSNQAKRVRKRYVNSGWFDIKELHDPARFGVSATFDSVREMNQGSNQ